MRCFKSWQKQDCGAISALFFAEIPPSLYVALVNENLPETIEEDHAHARLKSTSALDHSKLLQATWPSVFSSISPLTRQKQVRLTLFL